MRAVIEVVSRAEVFVKDKVIGQCGAGLLVYLGIHKEDKEEDAKTLAERIAHLRVLPDSEGKLGLSVLDLPEMDEQRILVIPNFTLLGDVWSGRRPNFSAAASFQDGKRLFDCFLKEVESSQVKVSSGIFGADMEIKNTAVGPITMIIDTKK